VVDDSVSDGAVTESVLAAVLSADICTDPVLLLADLSDNTSPSDISRTARRCTSCNMLTPYLSLNKNDYSAVHKK